MPSSQLRGFVLIAYSLFVPGRFSFGEAHSVPRPNVLENLDRGQTVFVDAHHSTLNTLIRKMRALESFYEAEQMRLALRDTLRVQRAVQQADDAAGVQTRPPSRVSSRNTATGDLDDDINSQDSMGETAKRKARATEGQSLIAHLPDTVVLDEIVASYLDVDTIMLVLPYLSHDWRKSIWGSTTGALLWRRLCLRAWAPLNLPIQRLLTTNSGNDWQGKFFKRPRVRLSGPYMTYTIFIQHPGPRNMWTPKDAPAVKVVYHHRFWWFREEGKVCCKLQRPLGVFLD